MENIRSKKNNWYLPNDLRMIPMKTAINANRLRCAEISAILAEQKRDFFVHGIEQPMGVRVTLEAELARLRYETLKLVDSENAQKAQVRQLRGEILKNELISLGHPDLISHCNRLAEEKILTTSI